MNCSGLVPMRVRIIVRVPVMNCSRLVPMRVRIIS